jgi:hypothetical protein
MLLTLSVPAMTPAQLQCSTHSTLKKKGWVVITNRKRVEMEMKITMQSV